MGALILVGHGADRRLESFDAAGGDRDHLLYLPSGPLLRVLSLGYNETLADLIFLWSIQYYGYYAGGVRYDYLVQIYERVITELDPRFRDAYLLGALILDVEARRPADAIRLLEKGTRRNPDDWLLPFEAGFIAYSSLGDYAQAAGYFRRSMERPGAHPVVRRFHAEMFDRLGDPRTSLRHWGEILRTGESEYVRRIAGRHVQDLTRAIQVQDLQAAVGAYRLRTGGPPGRLRELVDAGILLRVPLDPEGRPYLYDAATGTVSAPRRASRGIVP